MEFYHKCWAYSWEHLADTELGGWYGVLDRHNQQVSNPDCPPPSPPSPLPFRTGHFSMLLAGGGQMGRGM